MPYLIFNGDAFDALEYYKEIFLDFDILQMTNYDSSNKIQQAIIRLSNLHLIIGDSELPEPSQNSPETSIYIEFDDLNEIEMLYRKLKRKGVIHVPLDDYEMSKRYAWIQDKFGVYWQLNLS